MARGGIHPTRKEKVEGGISNRKTEAQIRVKEANVSSGFKVRSNPDPMTNGMARDSSTFVYSIPQDHDLDPKSDFANVI